MRTVFSNAEVAHVWAQQNQSHGRNSNDSFYFRGDTIYSDGSHFPIAKFHDYNTVLFTTQGYSNTTSRHISHTWSAISHKRIIMMHTISPIGKLGHVKNIREFFGDLKMYVGKQERARVADYTREIQTQIRYIQDYIDIFPEAKKYMSKPELVILEKGEEGLEELDGVFKSYKRKDALQRTKEKKAQEERRRVAELKAQEALKEWREGLHNWTHKLPNHKTYLRVAQGKVETSKNIVLEEAEAKRVFKFINICKEKQKDWRRNGQTFEIMEGRYQLDSVNKHGDMVAGCHTIVWAEIEAVAKQMNWI